jgi:Plasmid encoded RepA protein
MNIPAPRFQHNVDDDLETCIDEASVTAAEIARFVPDGDRGFLPVEFVMMTLPYRRPVETFWERSNGENRLTIQAGRFTDHKGEVHQFVPYGKHARAALLYLMTKVKLSGKRDIEIGGSFRAFAKAAGIPVSGKNARTAVSQLRALLRCTVAFTKVTKDDNGTLRVSEGQYVVSDKAELWLDVREEHLDEDGLLTSTVRISESLFASIMSDETRPIDLTKYAQLASGFSPMAMDIYVWLSARLWALERSESLRAFITWEQLHTQFGSESSLPKFKQNFERALEKVLEVDPGMRVQIWNGMTQRKGFKGLVLFRSPGSVTSLPGVTLPPIERGDGDGAA